MDGSPHILIADDRPKVRARLAGWLEQAGYRVSTMGHGAGLGRILATGTIDLIVIEVRAPERSSVVLCRELEAHVNSTPVIVLVPREDDAERLLALELCADHYVACPLDRRELLARVKALLRRARPEVFGDPGRSARSVRFADWRLDTATGELRASGGASGALSHGELALLLAFLRFPKTVLTRDQLLDLTRGPTAIVYDRAVDVQVSRLRRKLGEAGGEPLIRTVRGRGYLFTAEPRFEGV